MRELVDAMTAILGVLCAIAAVWLVTWVVYLCFRWGRR